MSTLNFSPYLPDEAKSQLAKYVYRSDDKSPIYKHFWRPLCRAAVNRLPVWLAPNVITVGALLLVSLVHVGFAWLMPNVTLNAVASRAVTIEEQERFLEVGAQFGSADATRWLAFFHPSNPDALAAGAVAPVWLYVAGAVTLFLYQFLDNMDGHQARRTGTSSPLGLLMDHGCDSVNCVIGGLSAATMLACGPTWKTWTMVSSTVIVFFFNTWEEYYRGALVLPVVNGANEGILMAIAMFLTSALFGSAFWLQYVTVPTAALPVVLVDLLKATPTNVNGKENTVFGLLAVDSSGETLGIMLNTAIVLLMAVSTLFTALGNIAMVAKCVRNSPTCEGHGKYGSGWLLARFPFIHALTRLIPLFVVSVMANYWLYNSPADVFRAHPRLASWTYGLLYSKLAIHLMVAHLCSVEFHPLRRTLIPFLYCGMHGLASMIARQHDSDGGSGRGVLGEEGAANMLWGDEVVLLREFFALSTATYLHLVVNVVVEMAQVLQVRVFTVPLEKQRATRAAEAAAAKKDRRE